MRNCPIALLLVDSEKAIFQTLFTPANRHHLSVKYSEIAVIDQGVSRTWRTNPPFS
jgi:hypothetical protein